MEDSVKCGVTINMGEINITDEFGQAIIRTVKHYNLQTILEIGSWDGTGSTQCFIEGMKNFKTPRLYCIEIEPDRYELLKTNTEQYSWITCINQSTLSLQTCLNKDFEAIWNSPYNKIRDNAKKSDVIKWFEHDMKNLQKTKKGYLDDDDTVYDGVLIDGSEFFGYSEYNLVKDRTNVLFLDDYFNAFKTNQVARELNESSDWEVIAGNRYTRNGYAIFKRKMFL